MQADLQAVCQHYYPQLVDGLVQSHGKVAEIYWGPPGILAGIALLEETKRRFGLFRDREIWVHSVCNETGPLELRKLFFELDELTHEATRLLARRARNIAIQRIYDALTVIVGEMGEFRAATEAAMTGTQPFPAEPQGTSAAPAEIKTSTKAAAKKTRSRRSSVKPSPSLPMLTSLVADIKAYVHQEALRRAEYLYLLGSVGGLLGLIALAAILQVLVPDATLAGLKASTYLEPMLAGGLGALLSIMLRMSSGTLNVEWEAGRTAVLITGLLKPIIGGISAGVAYLFVKTGLVSLVGSGTAQSDAFFLALGFIAGFGERWVPDMLSSTSKSLATAAAKSDGKQRHSATATS